MITFRLNEKPYTIPTSWEEVTFKQYIELLDLKDDSIQLIAIFTGLEYDYLKNAVIIGLDDILTAVRFVNTEPVFPGFTPTCGPYTIPINEKGAFNIQHESLGQFEDMRQVMKQVSGKDISTHTKAYVKYVAIYLQKIRDGQYNPLKAVDMEEEIIYYPAYEVCSLGAFFFLKLWSFSSGTKSNSPTTSPRPKKSQPVMNNSPKPSAPWQRSPKRRAR